MNDLMITRRALLAVGTTAVLAACDGPASTNSPSPSQPSESSPAPAPPTTVPLAEIKPGLSNLEFARQFIEADNTPYTISDVSKGLAQHWLEAAGAEASRQVLIDAATTYMKAWANLRLVSGWEDMPALADYVKYFTNAVANNWEANINTSGGIFIEDKEPFHEWRTVDSARTDVVSASGRKDLLVTYTRHNNSAMNRASEVPSRVKQNGEKTRIKLSTRVMGDSERVSDITTLTD